MNDPEAFPLCWPAGRPRSVLYARKTARFQTTFGKARDQVLREIRQLGGINPIISSNIPLLRNGLPSASARIVVGDGGIAVYFTRKKRQLCFACDNWITVDDNMHAIGLTISALRGIARWGTGDMMEAAFTGFAALPEKTADAWWIVLGVDHNSTVEQVRSAYTALAKRSHPDTGGSSEDFIRVQSAWDDFKRVTLCE